MSATVHPFQPDSRFPLRGVCMRIQEFCVNVLLVIGSILMILFIIPEWTPESEGYGLAASTLPNAMCAVIGVLAFFQLAGGLRRGLRWGGEQPVSLEVILHLIKYFGVMLLIFPAWKWLGFVPGGMVVLALLFLVTGIRNRVAVVAISLLLPVVCYVLLWYGLHIPTP